MSNYDPSGFEPNRVNAALNAELLGLDQFAVPDATDWLMTLIPKNTGSPVPGEGRPAPGLTTPFQVVGWRWGQGRAAAGDTLISAKTQGARTVSDLTIIKLMDSSTPVLASCCGTNSAVKEATLIAYHAGGQSNGVQVEFFKLVAREGAMRSHYIYTSARHGVPLEVLYLNFQSLEITYTPQTSRGGRGGSTTYNLVVPT